MGAETNYQVGDRVTVSMSDAEPQTGTVVLTQPERSWVVVKLDRNGRSVGSLVFHVSAITEES